MGTPIRNQIKTAFSQHRDLIQKLDKMTLRQLLEEMEDDRHDSLLKLYDDFAEIFHYAAGSSHNHQVWKGGYADHVADIIRSAILGYHIIDTWRPLHSLGVESFTLDSAIITLFLHDIEKPFRYGPTNDPRCKKWQGRFTDWQEWESAKWEIIEELQTKYGFELLIDEINALKYTHGEGDDHKKDERVSCPLAAFVHHCDNTSARIFHSMGKGLSR